MLRQLYREQLIPADPALVWEYFSSSKNLNELTPQELKFQIVSALPEKMYAGQLIEYRVSPVTGVWFEWLTEIRHVEEGRYFVDEQRRGPYKFWYHEHHFVPVGDGVRMIDRVTYDVGWGPLGRIAEKLWVGRQLQAIFAYRFRRVEEIFGAGAR
jgi:ligand-binding SRPBCC domain-containing protein